MSEAIITPGYRPRCNWCDARCVLAAHPASHGKSVDCRCERHAVPSHVQTSEFSGQECAGCCGTLARPFASPSHTPWVCQGCGAAWDPVTGLVARKTCLGCDAMLAPSDPDICTKCDEHGIIIVNGRAYAPV